jgi:hypothetical protein
MKSNRRSLALLLSVLGAAALAAPSVATAATKADTSAPASASATSSFLPGGARPLPWQRWQGVGPTESSGNTSIVNGFFSTGPELEGVTCVTATDCWAVGDAEPASDVDQTVVEHDTGTGWEPVSSPNAGPSGSDNALDAVACPVAGDCWAVGSTYDTASDTVNTLTEQDIDGVWSVVASPDATSTVDDWLNSIACPTTQLCWAVGTSNGGSGYQTLVLEYTPAGGWQLVTSPDVGTGTNGLNGVACAGASECWAVGAYEVSTTGPGDTLIEEDTGSGWAVVSSPSPGGSGTAASSDLFAASCASAGDCWAVGDDNTGTGNDQTLVEQYADGTWSAVSSPDTSGDGNDLGGVACLGDGDCWAAGEVGNNDYSITAPLVEENTGSGWTMVTGSLAGYSDLNAAVLNAVGCVSGPDCWAVGNITDSDTNTLSALTQQLATPEGGGGYTLDAFGGVHPAGDSPAVTTTGYWPGWRIAKAIVMDPCDTAGQESGWVLDGFGGLHPFAASGTAMPATPDLTGYWPGWSIANDFVAFCITVNGVQHAAGCVLDGFGGLHPWADSSAVIGDVSCAGTGYWPGWDIATKISVVPGTDQGYVMDGFGGLHPFNGAPSYAASGYWPGWAIARGVVATANGGYTVDGFGGIHPFGSAPAITTTAYWPGWDIARGLAVASGGTGAYTLDGFGGIHSAGGAPSLSASGYWPNWDIAVDFVSAP